MPLKNMVIVIVCAVVLMIAVDTTPVGASIWMSNSTNVSTATMPKSIASTTNTTQQSNWTSLANSFEMFVMSFIQVQRDLKDEREKSAQLIQRIQKLEKDQQMMKESNAVIVASVSGHKAAISNNTNNIAVLKASVNDMSDNMTFMGAAVRENANNIAVIKDLVNDNANETNVNNASVTHLENKQKGQHLGDLRLPLKTRGKTGGEVEFKCVFSQSDWYAFHFTRKRFQAGKDSYDTILWDAPSKPRYEFGQNISTSLRSRVEFIRYTQRNDLIFKITLRDLSCDDKAMYKCVVTSNKQVTDETELVITALPHAPKITPSNQVEQKLGTRLNLTCEGPVDLPFGYLTWYEKKLSSPRQKLTARHYSLESSGCQNYRYMKSSILVDITGDSQDAVYTCYSSPTNFIFYDQYTVALKVCPTGWTHRFGKCYRFTKCSKSCSGYSMKDSCEQDPDIPATLASVHSKAESDFVVSLAGPYPTEVFIGGRYEQGGWTWVDGSVWNYTNWNNNEPNDGWRPCLYIWLNNKKWTNTACGVSLSPWNGRFGYVCQQPTII